MKPITQDDVFFLLEPLVGLPLLMCHSEISQDIAALLRAYEWQVETTLDQLREQVESALFNGIYTYTQGSMAVKTVAGDVQKIYTDALSRMAEALMEPVFARLPVCEAVFEALNEYALRHLSLPALKRLYTDYSDRLQPMNHAIFARVIRENFAKEEYQDWLKDI